MRENWKLVTRKGDNRERYSAARSYVCSNIHSAEDVVRVMKNISLDSLESTDTNHGAVELMEEMHRRLYFMRYGCPPPADLDLPPEDN